MTRNVHSAVVRTAVLHESTGGRTLRFELGLRGSFKEVVGEDMKLGGGVSEHRL